MAKGKYEKWLQPENLILVEGWARDGLSNEQIAHNMGIALTTLKDWVGKFPTISTAIKKGKEVADYEVENALFRTACGYEVEETHVEIDEKGNKKVKRIKKHIAGNPTAQIFWLKNRKPSQWKDRREEVVTASIVDQTTIDEIEDFINGFSSGEEETSDTAEN